MNIKFIEQLVCDDDFDQREEKESDTHCQRVVSIQYQDSTSPCMKMQPSFGQGQNINEKISSLLSLPEISNSSGYSFCQQSYPSQPLQETHQKLCNKKANSGGPLNDCIGNFQLVQNHGSLTTQGSSSANCTSPQRGYINALYYESNPSASNCWNIMSTQSGQTTLGSPPYSQESSYLQPQRHSQTPIMHIQNTQVSHLQQNYYQQQYQPQTTTFQAYLPPPPYYNNWSAYKVMTTAPSQQQQGFLPPGMYQPAPYGATPNQYGYQQNIQNGQQQPFGNNIHQKYY